MTLALFSVGRTARIVHGDATDVVRDLAENSIDALVTDPPSAIKFMGREWDSDKGGRTAWTSWLALILGGCLRALKPGAHGLVWALPRKSHWTGLAVEDAGFEIRDRITHLFGEGMPKSPHVLKPAAEDWWLVRKPCEGSIAATVGAFGTGGLNINACRIEYTSEEDRAQTIVPQPDFTRVGGRATHLDSHARSDKLFDPKTGRWPANATLDETAAVLLDEQSGMPRSGAFPQQRSGIGYARNEGYDNAGTSGIRRETNVGGASRFFYVAKADDSDRTESGAVVNDHETVKNSDLMRWLIRLITPPGGIVLDPFAGSGTTGVACAGEGMSFIGIEQDAKHHETARQRLTRSFQSVEVSL